ncbi:MAG: sulfite exporter TauE/SafE family protein [Candidatus Cyclobacteriaceae bacterium M3_2C_046]
MTDLIGYIVAVLTGVTLGLIGGGGSILTVPVLVYLFELNASIATGYSLFVVGISALVGVVSYIKKGLLDYKTAVVFAIPSLIAVFIARKFLIPGIPQNLFTIGKLDITDDVFFLILLLLVIGLLVFLIIRRTLKQDIRFKSVFWLMVPAAIMVYVMRQFIIPALPQNLLVVQGFSLTKDMVIMLIFAFVMILSAFSMIRSRKSKLAENPPDRSSQMKYPRLVIQGLGVGTVTGTVGAGGGFLIVPALVVLAKLPMKLAVGTSLLIIATQSLIGFIGDISNHRIDWSFLLTFSGLSIVGIILGGYLSNFISEANLKKGFGYFVLLMGLFIFIKELIL